MRSATSRARRSWPSTNSACRRPSAACDPWRAPTGRARLASGESSLWFVLGCVHQSHDGEQAGRYRVATTVSLPVVAQMRMQPRRRFAPHPRRAFRRVGRRRRLFRSAEGPRALHATHGGRHGHERLFPCRAPDPVRISRRHGVSSVSSRARDPRARCVTDSTILGFWSQPATRREAPATARERTEENGYLTAADSPRRIECLSRDAGSGLRRSQSREPRIAPEALSVRDFETPGSRSAALAATIALGAHLGRSGLFARL